jgi:hypothetical protein
VPVILKRFFAPDFVFSLGILLSFGQANGRRAAFRPFSCCYEQNEPPRQPLIGRAVR